MSQFVVFGSDYGNYTYKMPVNTEEEHAKVLREMSLKGEGVKDIWQVDLDSGEVTRTGQKMIL